VTEAEGLDSRWLEPADLLRIARRDVGIGGDESLEAVIVREPSLLIRLGAPSTQPLDLDTYRSRRGRWECGEGPRLTGMGESWPCSNRLASRHALWACKASARRTGSSSILVRLVFSPASRRLTRRRRAGQRTDLGMVALHHQRQISAFSVATQASAQPRHG
jgi:hypothetical protein